MTGIDFTLSIIASIIASVIFIFLILFLLRPKVKIAPQICKKLDTYDDVQKDCYCFKIINLSVFSAYDINVELSSLVSYPVKDGLNFRYTPLQLKTDKLNFIAPYRPRILKKNYADYAMIFRTYENIEAILDKESNSIQIQITLKHGVTGLSKVYNMNFASCSEIKGGNFAFGKNFYIQ
jgi:hypothetical protein